MLALIGGAALAAWGLTSDRWWAVLGGVLLACVGFRRGRRRRSSGGGLRAPMPGPTGHRETLIYGDVPRGPAHEPIEGWISDRTGGDACS